jgi:hypothetical protein
MARPTKYKEIYVEKLELFTEAMRLDNLMSRCSVDHIACIFDVDKRTIYNWRDKNESFFHAIKRWEAKRNALFFELSQYSDGDHKKMAPAVWIFLSKNWLGLSDKQKLELSGDPEKPIKNKIEIEIVGGDTSNKDI